MKKKTIVMLAKRSIVHALPEPLHRIVGKPQGKQQERRVMWHPTCWPSGSKIPSDAKRGLW